jgi:cytochrome c553
MKMLPVLLLATLAGPAHADTPPPVPAKLGLCVACHGEDGRSRTPAAPHIGGQNEMYLVWALTQYREGRREGDVMSAVAGALGASDIEALARWYAVQRWPAMPEPGT